MMIKNEKGFTLIELLLATVIVIISIVPITMILPRMLSGNQSVERENRAEFLAQMKMEEMKTKALTAFDWNYNVTTATAFASPYNKFKYTIAYVDGGNVNIKKITVTVWYDANNNNTADVSEERIQFKTLIANRGEGV
jgi:Tfp pilus assembly protein PilV